ncbi:hypothetical protein PoB_007030800 [Plakobranchus ocellatus]|uniref:Uncharacterized protein n=1 Tax=Plakobranchus ocellatus TaxID=259542 RepID=A0AAV4DHP2_9GAST|nr:hypothetical protein PoB_007030800 [Plakobranchus ocellatus]
MVIQIALKSYPSATGWKTVAGSLWWLPSRPGLDECKRRSPPPTESFSLRFLLATEPDPGSGAQGDTRHLQTKPHHAPRRTGCASALCSNAPMLCFRNTITRMRYRDEVFTIVFFLLNNVKMEFQTMWSWRLPYVIEL